MAKGSKRSFPTAPAWAAVVSELMIEPRKTPCSQSKASVTSGTLVARRPPKRMAEIGTPAGSSHSGAIDGHWAAPTVKRALGWAAGVPDSGVQSWPFQSFRWAGGLSVRPSHQMSASSVSATLVNTQSWVSMATALGFVFSDVPGATPKKPASGLGAERGPAGADVL